MQPSLLFSVQGQFQIEMFRLFRGKVMVNWVSELILKLGSGHEQVRTGTGQGRAGTSFGLGLARF